MASPFAETLRSRRVDLFRLWILVLGGAIALALGWGAWFVAAPLERYESSRRVWVSGAPEKTSRPRAKGGRRIMERMTRVQLTAELAAPAAPVTVGQKVAVRVAGAGGDVQTILATVDRVEEALPGGSTRVVLWTEPQVEALRFPPDATLTASFLVETLTPLDVLLRVVGLHDGRPSVVATPHRARE